MLDTKLTKTILHTTDTYISSLEKWWIKTVWDLLNHFPKEYEDRTNVIDSFSFINIKEKNTILVKLISIENTKTSSQKILTKAIIEDKNGFMSECVWFNRKFLTTQLQKYVQRQILVVWKVKYEFWRLSFVSPEIETDLSKVWGEIVPVYSDVNYIPWSWIAWKMEHLKLYTKYFTETLPEKIINKYNFISKSQAIYLLHFPKTKQDFENAKYRLAYEELYEVNFKSISKKLDNFSHSTWKSLSIKLNPDLIKSLISKLPFELTNAQKISLFQILKDMEKLHAMQRLLEWDVWTWKTVIAAISAIHTILELRKNFNEKIPHPNPPLTGEGIDSDRKSTVLQNYQETYLYIKDLLKKLRKEQTNAEDLMWQILRKKQIFWLKFRRQHPFGRYIADFYCSDIKLVIELDWEIHNNLDKKEYDNLRDEIISNYWVKILRVSNEDVFNNTQKIIDSIFDILSPVRGKYPEGDRGIFQENSSFKNNDEWGIIWKNNKTFQIAIMAPTEILARQHFEWLFNMFFENWISSELLVGSTTAKNKEIIKQKLKSWDIDVIIWTHALIQEDVIFKNLVYVIIDEQHRFWVKQRWVLESWLWNQSWIVPHNLNMTATPIPRTLALTLYWDQDLSIINEYPKDRKLIHTKVIHSEDARSQVELFIRSQLESWRQVFWISPLVEESEKMDLANAINTFESLVDIFSPFKVWLLHWKMKPKEKEEIMNQFVNNEIQVLSSTSVVEVWVNVPNATIMCIEWAERFGLSQLHQFRWRVWRGSYQSYCYLFPTTWKSTDRLKAMEKTNNWFDLSEIDLELRWPGEVYWVRQSWIPEFKIADLRDLGLISQIREDIEELFEKKLDS